MEIGIVGFWKEENRRSRRKTLGARTRTNNKLSPHVVFFSDTNINFTHPSKYKSEQYVS